MPEDRVITVGSDQKEGLQLTFREGRVLISGLWKGRTGKSQKGQPNFAWCAEDLFKEAAEKYLGLKSEPGTDRDGPPDDDDVPF